MRNLNYDEITSRNRRMLARDDGPDNPALPPANFGKYPGFGPVSGSTNIEQDEDDPEMEEKVNAICEALGIDPAQDRRAYDWVRRRAMDRRRARDRRVSRDGAETAEWRATRDRLRAEADQAADRAYPRRGAHDAAPRRPLTFEDRFPETLRIGIQG